MFHVLYMAAYPRSKYDRVVVNYFNLKYMLSKLLFIQVDLFSKIILSKWLEFINSNKQRFKQCTNQPSQTQKKQNLSIEFDNSKLICKFHNL